MNKQTHEDGTPFSKEEFLRKLEIDSEFNEEFGNKGIDQISNAIHQLKTNPDNRRIMVNAWNVADIDKAILPPCHYGFQLWSRELTLDERNNYYTTNYNNSHEELDEWNVPKRELSLLYNARSQDVPLGTPFNIASYGLLLWIFAKECNMLPGELITMMGDCHIYLNQMEGIEEQLSRNHFDLPGLGISDDLVFGEGIDKFLESASVDKFWLHNYKSHPAIKIPLSN